MEGRVPRAISACSLSLDSYSLQLMYVWPLVLWFVAILIVEGCWLT